MSTPVPGRIAFLLALALCLSSAAVGISAEPQEGDPQSLLGSRIRITPVKGSSLPERIDGQVIGFEGTHLVLASSNGTPSQTVPLTAVHRLEVHHGRKRATKRGFWSGAAIGGVTGAIGGAVYGSYVTLDRDMSANPTGSMLVGGAVGGAVCGLVGGGIGAGIGALFTEDDWRDAPAPRPKAALSLQPTRGGVKVALSVSF